MMPKTGRHYRKRRTAAAALQTVCGTLYRFTARTTGRHSRMLQRLRTRLTGRI